MSNNPYKTSKYKPTFTLAQAKELAQNLVDNKLAVLFYSDNQRKVYMADYLNNRVVDQPEILGLIPAFAFRTTHDDLLEGVIEEYGFPVPKSINNALISNQGYYLYDKYDADECDFDPPLPPLMILIDTIRKQFLIQYPYSMCIFGGESGDLTLVRLD